MDEFIDIVRNNCIKEKVLNLLHIILHADDTAVLSTNRQLFIEKCNTLIAAFDNKKVSLNLKKSSFLVINPANASERQHIKLNSGWLKYAPSYVYLGIIISDKGSIVHDLSLHVAQKAKNIYVKLANFMRNNESAPIIVKRKILKSCMNSSLLYGCELWAGTSLRRINALQKKAIKITHNMSSNTPNPIVYIETGIAELKGEILKRQYNFWLKIMESLEKDPDSEISKILNCAIAKNIAYIKHYKALIMTYRNAEDCRSKTNEEFWRKMKGEVVVKVEQHVYSPLNTYLKINPRLVAPVFYEEKIPEWDRKLLTKYRTGAHDLKIRTGYYGRTPEADRLCSCKEEVQTLQHVLFDCSLTVTMRPLTGNTLESFFCNNEAINKLQMLEVILKLRRW